MSAQLIKYETIEINGYICVWNPSTGTTPDWYPTRFEPIHEPNIFYRGKSTNIIYTHIQVRLSYVTNVIL